MRTNDFCTPEHSVLFALKSEISDRYDPTPTFLKRVDRALIVGKNRSGISPLVPENELCKDWSILVDFKEIQKIAESHHLCKIVQRSHGL